MFYCEIKPENPFIFTQHPPTAVVCCGAFDCIPPVFVIRCLTADQTPSNDEDSRTEAPQSVSQVKNEAAAGWSLVVRFSPHPLCLRYPECKAAAWLESLGFRRSGGVTGSPNGSSDCGARSVFSTAADYQQKNPDNKQKGKETEPQPVWIRRRG